MSVENDSKGTFMEYQAYEGNEEDNNKAPVDVTQPGKFEADSDGVRVRQAEEYNAYSTDYGNPEDALSTLQNSYGGPVSNLENIDPHRCTIEVDGMRTSLANAMHLGYITHDKNGYHVGKPAPIGQPESQQTEQNLSHPVLQAVNEMRAALGDNLTDGSLASVIGASINDEDPSHAYSKFANNVGLEADEGQQVVEEVISELEESLITGTVQKYGLESGALKQFLGNCDGKVKVQLLLRVLHGEPRVWQDVASRFRFGNIR